MLYINNELMKLVRVGATRNGYAEVTVGPENVAVTQHSIPRAWLDDETSPAVLRGGNWYSHKVRGHMHFGGAPRPANVELQRLPVISISHLSQEAVQMLTDNGEQMQYLVTVATYTEGFFIRVHDGAEEDDWLPQSIRDVAVWAKKNRFEWVRLDRDAETIDGLTSYDC